MQQDKNGEISLSMFDYLRKNVQHIAINKEQKSKPEDFCSPEFHGHVRKFAGSLNYLGQAVLPQASFVASWAQQQLGRHKHKHIIQMNKQFAELQKLSPIIRFKIHAERELATCASIVAFSDASHGASSYGQSGYTGGFFIELSSGCSIHHIIDWHSGKQKRVSFSSGGSEIIAAADATDRAGYMHELYATLLGPDVDLQLSLLVDSRGLHDTITTLHEPSDYRLRPTVARIRDSFESKEKGELTGLGLIPGPLNVSDCLTKCNRTMWAQLQKMFSSGSISLEQLDAIRYVDSGHWT